MRKITFVSVLITLSASIHVRRQANFRVLYGTPDTKGKYPYVIAIIADDGERRGAGTLIAPEWVLTVGHVVDDTVISIQYGNMSLKPSQSKTVSRIVDQILHPGYRDGALWNIALFLVEPVPVNIFGRISGIDYLSFMGKKVEYAGYGLTEDDESLGETIIRPLQVGEGIVISCEENIKSHGPYICVAPKCSNNLANIARGDSGTPLFFDNKIVGITGWGDKTPIGGFTAVSPFITWIEDTIASRSRRRKLQ